MKPSIDYIRETFKISQKDLPCNEYLESRKKNTFQKALNNIYSKEKETYMIPTGKNQND